MYTAQQIDTVIAYNNKSKIFYTTPKGTIRWDMRNGDVAELAALGVPITYAEEFAQLKKQVKKVLQSA